MSRFAVLLFWCFNFLLVADEPAPTSRWVRKADMPSARAGAVAATLENTVYVIGGRTWRGGANDFESQPASRIVEAYEPESDRWTIRRPAPISPHRALAMKGKIYAFGEDCAEGPKPVAYVYDPGVDRWRLLAPMPTARAGFALAALNGKVYAIGGWAAGREVDAVEEYDAKTNAWTVRPALPKPGHAFPALALGNRIYVLGGAMSTGMRGVWVYDPAANAWSGAAPMRIQDGYFAAFESKGKVLALPGMFTAPWVMQEYDPGANSWRVLNEPAPAQRRMYVAAPANGKVYVFGGVEGIEWENWTKEFLTVTEEYSLRGTRIE
jgi:N-acetylneuraminic acid mutarotase